MYMTVPDPSIIHRNEFEKILVEEFGLTEKEVKNLIQLVAPAFDDNINYKSFFNFLRSNVTQNEPVEGMMQPVSPREEEETYNLTSDTDRKINILTAMITPVIKAELLDALDSYNSRVGLRGTITYQDLMMVFLESSLKVETSVLKEFVSALPREEDERGEETWRIENLKGLIKP